MASKRRSGFRPPELRGTLGTLIRTTTGVVRDALERGAREGRARLDDVRSSRRRHDALADLGELVLDLIRRGEIDLAELPEARDLVHQLDQLDADAEADEPPPPRSITRRRFDDRSHAAPDDDGTVSSGAALRAARPTTRPRTGEPVSARAPTRPLKTVWRPPTEEAAAADAPSRTPRAGRADLGEHGSGGGDQAGPGIAERSEHRSEHRRPPLPRDPGRKGGISFDDDEDDLADYMHPDDVPPKTPPGDPDDHGA